MIEESFISELEEDVSKEIEISEEMGIKEILEMLIDECVSIRRVLNKCRKET